MILKQDAPTPGSAVVLQGKPVALMVQDNVVRVWFDSRAGAHDVQLIGTGWNIPFGWTYVATTQAGPYVWHLLTRAAT